MGKHLFSADPGDFIRMVSAVVRFGTDELNLRSLLGDTPKFVLEAKSNALGAWSARYVDPQDNVTELALIQYKKDERTRGRDDVLYGEWTVHLKGPSRPNNPDGMELVFLGLHDYVWIRGISPTPYPQPPAITLPPPPEPPADPWLTPEEQRKHLTELHRIEQETGIPMDSDRFDAYMSGRNRNLAEVHDDEMARLGFDTDSCNGVNRIPL